MEKKVVSITEKASTNDKAREILRNKALEKARQKALNMTKPNVEDLMPKCHPAFIEEFDGKPE